MSKTSTLKLEPYYPPGTRIWRKDGEIHSCIGPAILYPDGTSYWYKRGKLHRADGPAIVYSNGEVKYYLNGYAVSERKIKTLKSGKSSLKDKLLDIWEPLVGALTEM